MASQLKALNGSINPLNRYGIADAARTRISAQIFRNVMQANQKDLARAKAEKNQKAHK